MQKQAPDTRPHPRRWRCFALSCFGLLLYLWVAFGGGFPLKPQGYRFHVRFGEATQLAQQADVRISGVPVGKVVKLELGPGRGDRRDDPARRALRADPERRARDPAPEDAARRDLRRADAGPQERRDAARGRRAAATRRCRRRSSSTRSSARSTRRRAQRVPGLDAVARAGIAGRGQDLNRRARQPRAVRRGHERRC